ncbi:MgtC/SapB family protein [Clostridium formicaceticum]|uniref:Methyltransferase n=1 Tax=Clostridium formicaceticum TaxID=1497 RepID=A0AAC9RIH8_9CLOT|nr:MgtC/SapB family protein [Clostridium formicaceticum]AOY76060.1 methyltransferase [Clostridium formicaceticum]ARE86422.1 putative Mg(2+) transport ATPase [Clostridium formicaceticum]
MISNMDLIFRLLLATVLGGFIGFEREVNNRPAGFRTHILVTVGSCLIMVLSIYAFMGFGPEGRGGEPARLAAQVVSGIGFLGAGTIMREGTNVRGLTTAASIWISGGIGLAVGTGFYLGAVVTTAIALFSLSSLRILERRIAQMKRYSEVKIKGIGRPGFIGEIGTVFGRFHISIKNIVIENEFVQEDQDYQDYEYNIQLTFFIKIPAKLNRMELYCHLKQVQGIESVVWDNIQVIFNNKIL